MREVSADRQRLARRLRYLWTGELSNVFFQPAVLFVIGRASGQPLGPGAWYAVAVTCAILLQGAAYWWLKLRALRSEAPIPAAHLRPFKLFKALNPVLLAFLPLLLIVRTVIAGAPFASPVDALATILYGLLALAEQINYHHRQLSYDNRADLAWLWRHRRLKEPALARDLRRVDAGTCASSDIAT